MDENFNKTTDEFRAAELFPDSVPSENTEIYTDHNASAEEPRQEYTPEPLPKQSEPVFSNSEKNHITEIKDTEKKPKLRFPFGYFAIILAVCIVISSLSGAGGAFFMYRMLSPVSTVPEESTGNSFDIEDSFTEEIITETPVNTGNITEENTFTPSVTTETSTAETTTEESITEQYTLTKGDIYSAAVHSIVAITATWNQQYYSLFGTYSRLMSTSGTGFVISSSGHIITNHHVIENGTSITVTDYEGNEYSAEVVGTEPSNDFAIIKINADTIPVTLGKSSELKVGDEIMVIGNALGELSYSFTDGIVSHLSRNVTVESGDTINMFQTNAAINNGNSGGPVYNMNGEVVGIASAKYASDTIEGLGFCIPIDDVKDMITDILLYGYVTGKPSIGVSLQTVTDATSSRYSIPKGCYVVDIDLTSSAYSAGLRTGDVITGIDSKTVSSCDDLSDALSDYTSGSTVTLFFWRNSQTFSVQMTLGENKPTAPRTDYSNVYDF